MVLLVKPMLFAGALNDLELLVGLCKEIYSKSFVVISIGSDGNV